MQIALDAFEAGFEPLTGTGRYVRALLKHLGPVTAFHKRGHQVPGGTPLRCPANRTVWSQLRLPAALARRRFDVVHVPGPRVPWLKRGALVSTIHDLAFLKFPEMFRPGHRQRLEFFTRQALKRSHRLIAVSDCTKRDLEAWGARTVDVVHHGVDHDLFKPDGPVTRRERPYILSVGALQPRKNFLTLIRAYRQLSRPVDLLIAGQRGWMYEEIERAAGNGVVLLGHVSDAELPALYRGAAVVAMPSLYEGFGLPVLEAMACGAPVVASNASCFPEVCGDAATLVGPDEWVEALRQALDRPPARERSLKRAAEFTWEKTAAKTLEVYRKAVG
jgi:glycosyltransferase involved in cell wall biosynthesis